MIYVAKFGTLNLVQINSPADISKFPKEVQGAIHIEEDGVRVDSREYEYGEVIPYDSYIAWEPCVHINCPIGYNLWNKINTIEQLKTGILKEVDGKFIRTRAVPLQAELFTGDLPKLLADKPIFEDQIKIHEKILYVDTPWGISSGECNKAFVIIYGIYTSEQVAKKYKGTVEVNILTPRYSVFRFILCGG